MPKRIVVVGGGFAGLWAALAAVRRLDELRLGPDEVEVTLVNRDAWHSIRVRNYEADISAARIPLAELTGPAGIRLVIGDVKALDVSARRISLEQDGHAVTLSYDRLVLAAGSRLRRPDIPGLAAHGFSIDTWDEAAALQAHMTGLPQRPPSPARDTVLIIGGGLTGIELACEMPQRLASLGLHGARVLLADRQPAVGWDMGEAARAQIDRAFADLGVTSRGGVAIRSIDAGGAELEGGERIAAETVVWTAGMQASPLAQLLPAARDALGRLMVDSSMRLAGVAGVLAAGDIATAPLPGSHTTVMSCQFARPMGRFAGHNAVADLLEHDLLAMDIERYVTCLDLGPWGALFTEGWDRRVSMAGMDAKRLKVSINCERIYPPRTGLRRDLLEAAAPIAQPPPRAS